MANNQFDRSVSEHEEGHAREMANLRRSTSEANAGKEDTDDGGILLEYLALLRSNAQIRASFGGAGASRRLM